MPEHPRRILIVTRNLPPLLGGMERLNWHMADQLARVAEVRVIGPAGSAANAPDGIAVHEAPLTPLWQFLLGARHLARREARRWQPHIVLAGSGLTAPLARGAARTCNATTAAYVHGLDVALKHPAYRAVWLPAIRRMDRVVANSSPTAELCLAIGVDDTRIGIVHPGVDLPAPPSPTSAQETNPGRAPETSSFRTTPGADPECPGTASQFGADNLRQRHQLGNRPLLLSVGRLSSRKGLREFVTNALPRIVAAQPEALLLIVGDAPDQALHAESQTPASIRTAANEAGVGEHIRFLGAITDYHELGVVYHAAAVHVFPARTIPGDPEGFGMVAVEAAAHGLPTVAFAAGGVIDAVAEGQSGHLVPAGDYAALAEAVLQTIDERETLHASSISFAQQFAWPEFGARLAEQLRLKPEKKEQAE